MIPHKITPIASSTPKRCGIKARMAITPVIPTKKLKAIRFFSHQEMVFLSMIVSIRA
ncbi:hypothetical protein [Kordia sp.]|uniref:hypothetical protein n=1 Tax=Kordia sp. TaxID=1965332 RepID=UPI0025B935D6|nr:hypothetical protein [Kordia sp.]